MGAHARRICIGDRASAAASDAGDFIHRYFVLRYQHEMSVFQSGKVLAEPRMLPHPSVQCVVAAQAKNPYSLVIVYRGAFIVGVVELWAMRKRTLHALLTKRCSEFDLRGGDFRIYTPTIDRLYVAITVPTWEPEQVSIATLRACLAGTLEVLEAAYFARRHHLHAVQAYALEASANGRILMEDLGFVRAGEFSKRGDPAESVWTCRLTASHLELVRERWCNRRVSDYG